MRTEKRARRSSRLLVLATLAVLAGVSGQVLMGAAHGVLDTTFSSDGKTTVDFGDDDRARAVVVQPDGKVIVVGTNDDGLANFAVARFNPDGSLDTSFSTDGKTTVTFGASDFAQAVALQTDGKIVVAGYTNAGGDNDFAVARLNADGTQDTTFSGDGEFTIDFGNDDQATSVAIQDDGNIIVAGFTDNGSADFAVARVTIAFIHPSIRNERLDLPLDIVAPVVFQRHQLIVAQFCIRLRIAVLIRADVGILVPFR